MKIKIATAAIVGLVGLATCRTTLRAHQTTPPRQTPVPAVSHSVRDGVYTTEQAKRGEAVYSQQCSSCHGPALEGGEALTPLAGSAFLANWSGMTVDDLFEKIRASMPQDDPGRLSQQQNTDVVAYILSANQLPSGETELAREKELLKLIRFEAP